MARWLVVGVFVGDGRLPSSISIIVGSCGDSPLPEGTYAPGCWVSAKPPPPPKAQGDAWWPRVIAFGRQRNCEFHPRFHLEFDGCVVVAGLILQLRGWGVAEAHRPPADNDRHGGPNGRRSRLPRCILIAFWVACFNFSFCTQLELWGDSIFMLYLNSVLLIFYVLGRITNTCCLPPPSNVCSPEHFSREGAHQPVFTFKRAKHNYLLFCSKSRACGFLKFNRIWGDFTSHCEPSRVIVLSRRSSIHSRSCIWFRNIAQELLRKCGFLMLYFPPPFYFSYLNQKNSSMFGGEFFRSGLNRQSYTWADPGVTRYSVTVL